MSAVAGTRPLVAQRAGASRRASIVSVGTVAGAVVAGSVGVLATSPLGSGDYGQWLMAARPYLGEAVPAYRADAAVPPVVPLLIGMVGRLAGDGATMIHVTAILLLVALCAGAWLAAASLFRSRLAASLAVVGVLLVTDVFFDLFAFGGLLQAGAVMWLYLAVAAYAAGGRGARGRSVTWWFGGAASTGIGALTHMGTASIGVPTGLVLAVIGARMAGVPLFSRRSPLVPLGLALAVVGAVWLAVLLPGSTELARNPASLNYRGPWRLVEALTAYRPSILLLVAGAMGLGLGLRGELLRGRLGAWTMLAAWTGVTVAVIAAAIVSSASTDYPRFATPLMAPFAVAAAGPAAGILAWVGGRLARATARGWRRGWTLAILAAAVVISTPWTVTRFSDQVAGYALADAAALNAVAAWIDAELPSDATVLAPVREAKWIEGLTGRSTLFSGAIRYSFRPSEWDRSLAADTLLRSHGALVNPFFFARFTDADPTSTAPHGLSLGVNHGGEYVDLLRTVPTATTVSRPDEGIIARLANLPADAAMTDQTVAGAAVDLRWSGSRGAGLVNLRQTVSLASDGSTLVLDVRASGEAVAGAGITLASGPPVSR